MRPNHNLSHSNNRTTQQREWTLPGENSTETQMTEECEEKSKCVVCETEEKIKDLFLSLIYGHGFYFYSGVYQEKYFWQDNLG